MRRILLTTLGLLALLLAAGAGTALAQGNAGVDEYTETFPGAGGNQPTGGDEGDGGTGGASPLTPAQVAELEQQGADGAAAAEIAQGTAPDRSGDGDSSGGGGSSSLSDSVDPSPGVAGVVGDLAGGSDDGMGIALPIVLGLALLGAIGYVVARRRAASRGA